MTRRLEAVIAPQQAPLSLAEELDKDYETLGETSEEWPEDDATAPLPESVRAAVAQEINDLKSFTDLALSIEDNAKGKALLIALERAFAEADRLGAARKAIIFTESRRTQDYLLRVLASSPFNEGIVLFNGSNTDERSRAIYTGWLA